MRESAGYRAKLSGYSEVSQQKLDQIHQDPLAVADNSTEAHTSYAQASQLALGSHFPTFCQARQLSQWKFYICFCN